MERRMLQDAEREPRKRRAPGRQRGGFTLIELVAVMAVLALLASLAAPQVVKALNQSKEKACAANVKMIEDAANLYATNETSPTPLTANNIINTLTVAGYLTRGEFKCPVDGTSYVLAGDATSGYRVTCPIHGGSQ